MCIEYIRFKIDETIQKTFIRVIGDACQIMAAYPDCLGYEVSQCEEDPLLFTWRIKWTSAEAHLEGFRKDKIFTPFYQVMEPYINSIQEMYHYNVLYKNVH